MGAEHSKERLELVELKATAIIESYRQSNGAIDKNQCIQNLKKLSDEAVKCKKASKRRVDNAIVLIEDLIREISNGELRRVSDTFIATSSFVNIPVSRRQSRYSVASTNSYTSEVKPKKNLLGKPVTSNTTSMGDIDNRLKSLKQEIKTAIDNNDSKSLRTIEKTINVLSTDLQMIQVEPASPLQEKHEAIQRQLTTCYNKVNKAIKEIRKSRELEHQLNTSNKTANKKQFDILEKAVQEQTIMLDTALKTDNSLLVKHVFDKIEEFNLVLVTLEDSPRKQKLIKQVEEMRQKTNDRLALYTVANRLTEHEKDFETIKNKKDSNNKKLMENLKRHVENIQENSENSIKRKKKLLKDVNDYINSLETEEIILRNKNNTLPTIQSLDKLIIEWNKTKECLQHTKTIEEAKNIYLSLSKLETSIRDTRKELQSKFDFRKSQVSFKDDTSSHVSNKSYTNPALIKTKAKIYNIPVDEVKNLTNTVAVDKTDKKTETLNDIRNIQTKFNFIKEKLNADPKNDGCRAKLQNYHDVLTEYIASEHENVSTKAKSVQNEITEVLMSLQKRPIRNSYIANNRMSVEQSLERIVNVQTNVDDIEREILKDLENPENLAKHKENLLLCKEKLTKININSQYEMLRTSKEEVVQKINYCINLVESKLNYGFNRDSKEGAIKEELTKLKDQVKRFTGGYKNVLYNEIETKLNKLLLNATESVQDETTQQELVKEIEKHLKILEQRSTKAQSFRDGLGTSSLSKKQKELNMEKQINEINEDLSIIKSEIRIMDPLALKGRLNLLVIELDHLNLKSDENLKSKICDLQEDIAGCINFVTSRINTECADETFQEDNILQLTKRSSFTKNKAEVKLSNIQLKVDALKENIENFKTSHEDPHFDQLDDEIVDLTNDLSKIDVTYNEKLTLVKYKLMSELDSLANKLENRAIQSKALQRIENDIDAVKKMKPNFALKEDIEDLDETLTSLQIRLSKLDVDKVFYERKNVCFDFIKSYLLKLRSIVVTSTEGTLV